VNLTRCSERINKRPPTKKVGVFYFTPIDGIKNLFYFYIMKDINEIRNKIEKGLFTLDILYGLSIGVIVIFLIVGFTVLF
jgi:hypothetical protein